MATATKKRKVSASAANGKKRKKTASKGNPRRKKTGHRNPNFAATFGSTREMITGGIAGLAAAVATRQLPQVVLGASNTGVEGYAANAATAAVVAWAAGAFAGPAAGRGALIGGLVILYDRILSDNVSPISSYLSLSGVGDHQAYSKLGTIRTGYYTHPSLQNPDGSLYVPDPYTQAALAAMPQPAPAPAGMAGGKMGAVNPSAMRRHTASGMLLSSRFQGRFNQ